MQITVLTGSPKGELSVTFQYVRYLQKKFPGYHFKIFHVAKNISSIKNFSTQFDEILDSVLHSNIILWAFPVYFFLVHSSYKQFIEMLFEKNRSGAFNGKIAGIITTSIHFFDNTAIRYMCCISEDMGCMVADIHTAEMLDMLQEKGRLRLLHFCKCLVDAAENKSIYTRTTRPLLKRSIPDYNTAFGNNTLVSEKKVIILTDTLEGNIGSMVRAFTSQFDIPPEIYTLDGIDMSGPCMGCLQCGPKNKCVYENKDGYIRFFKTKLQTADVLIFCGQIKDRYLSSKWKCFFDRSFFTTHQKAFIGKQFGFLISGPFSQTETLNQIIHSYVEFQDAHLVGIVSDESGNNELLSMAIATLARESIRNAQWNYTRKSSFLGIAGTKIFRDKMFGVLRIIFKADHKVYKKMGIYDFPNTSFTKRAWCNVIDYITRIPPIQNVLMKKVNQLMIRKLVKMVKNR